jgi:hypothetical protein
LPHALEESVQWGFGELISREGYGNARDVITVHEKMMALRDERCDWQGNVEGDFRAEDVVTAFKAVFEQRPISSSTDTRVSAPPSSQPVVMAPPPRELAPGPASTVELEAEEEEWVEVEEADVQREESAPDDDALTAALDTALAEMGYDIYFIRDILVTQDLPPDLIQLVASKLDRSPAVVTPMLRAQCPILLPATLDVIRSIEHELEREREHREALERADEAEKVRLKVLEEKRQREAVMERVKMIGRCPVGYEWIKEGNGYRCAGGSHFVSDAQVNTVEG